MGRWATVSSAFLLNTAMVIRFSILEFIRQNDTNVLFSQARSKIM